MVEIGYDKLDKTSEMSVGSVADASTIEMGLVSQFQSQQNKVNPMSQMMIMQQPGMMMQ
jgi:hypothetical protein